MAKHDGPRPRFGACRHHLRNLLASPGVKVATVNHVWMVDRRTRR
jgi:hypothetical protein